MNKINKIIYDIKTDIDNNTSKYIIILGVLFVDCSKNEEELINQTIRHFEPARPYVEVILVKNKI